MSRSSRDDWDTPGGRGGHEVLAQLQGSRSGGARALYRQWQEAVTEITVTFVVRSTVRPQVFNTFRRARLDVGVSDTQLAESFRHFAAAVLSNVVSVHQGDLWRTYAGGWSRWVSAAPGAPERPLAERGQRRRQR